MDAREARRYIMNNPPPDSLVERRPSFLGRLFRRSSSISEETTLSSSPPKGSQTLEIILSPGRQPTTATPTVPPIRRDSITEAVQTHFSAQQQQQPKKNVMFVDPDFNIYT